MKNNAMLLCLHSKRSRYLSSFLKNYERKVDINKCTKRHYSHSSLSNTVQSQDFVPVINSLRESVSTGDLLHNEAQEKAAKRLSRLQNALVNYSNEDVLNYIKELERKDLERRKNEDKISKDEEKQAGWKKSSNSSLVDYNRLRGFQVLETNKPKPSPKNLVEESETHPSFKIPRGLFLHGKVGTGKTHLMDLFYKYSPIPKEFRKRVHFHAFMQDVHKRIHQLKIDDLEKHGRNFSIDLNQLNPVHRVGAMLASEVRLLCFDEFQVTDVADALILSQLFRQLFQRGTVIVATSNRDPESLYEGGINRSYFLPFIDLLCRHCIVHNMNHDTDYRVVTTDGRLSFFFTVSRHDNSQQFNEFMSTLETNAQTIESNFVLKTEFNREVTIPTCYSLDGKKIARFDFASLCKAEFASSDYREIARQFGFCILENIPVLTLKGHDEARRFITLIDELYEANCSLICSAETAPSADTLFVGRNQDSDDNEKDSMIDMNSIETEVGEALGIDVAQSNGMTAGELASVKELSFAFKRAASRIKEMTSASWWSKNGFPSFSSK